MNVGCGWFYKDVVFRFWLFFLVVRSRNLMVLCSFSVVNISGEWIEVNTDGLCSILVML